jgi:bacterioferritin
MEQEKFIALLNEDLETEYQSIVQYIQHVATISGAEWLSTIEELREHLGQEVQHALTLADQIDFLGGVPTVAVPQVQGASEARVALEADLQLESNQLERYRERVAQAQDLGLPDVAEALRPLLEQTQDHVHDLQTVLDK